LLNKSETETQEKNPKKQNSRVPGGTNERNNARKPEPKEQNPRSGREGGVSTHGSSTPTM